MRMIWDEHPSPSALKFRSHSAFADVVVVEGSAVEPAAQAPTRSTIATSDKSVTNRPKSIESAKCFFHEIARLSS